MDGNSIQMACLLVQVEAIKVTVAGMKADNEARIQRQELVSYAEGDFTYYSELLMNIVEKLKLLRDSD